MSKQKKRAQSGPSRGFFARQLKGEEPVSMATGQALCDLARQFLAVRPWDSLEEDDLIFVEDLAHPDPHVCSVMGARGEFHSLTAYLGPKGYYLFRRLLTAESMSVGEFFAEQRTVSIEYVRREELTRPDRELLKAAGYPPARMALVPIFRAIRPGYHSWYVTETEAGILVDCLAAMNWMCDHLEQTSDAPYWDKEGRYPLMSRGPADGDSESWWNIRIVDAPVTAPVTVMPALPALDQQRIQRILARAARRGGVLEVEHFYSGAKVGKKDERKACLRVAFAAEGETGHAFPPEVCSPDAATGDMLVDALLKAVETSGRIPREIHVRTQSYRALLDALALALGSEVAVRDTLPALEPAKNALLSALGDRGPIPMGKL